MGRAPPPLSATVPEEAEDAPTTSATVSVVLPVAVSSNGADDDQALLHAPLSRLSEEQLLRRMKIVLNQNRSKFGVVDDRILGVNRRAIPRSNVQKSLKHIIDKRAGLVSIHARGPPGTNQLETKLKTDIILYSWTRPSVRKREAAVRKFRPQTWN